MSVFHYSLCSQSLCGVCLKAKCAFISSCHEWGIHLTFWKNISENCRHCSYLLADAIHVYKLQVIFAYSNLTTCLYLPSPLPLKVSVKLSLCLTKHHAMKTYFRSRGRAPLILNIVTRWMWMVNFMPHPFYPREKGLHYPLGTRLGGPQSRSGRGGEEKNSHRCPLPEIEPRSSSP
jgi:hypothetical protein